MECGYTPFRNSNTRELYSRSTGRLKWKQIDKYCHMTKLISSANNYDVLYKIWKAYNIHLEQYCTSRVIFFARWRMLKWVTSYFCYRLIQKEQHENRQNISIDDFNCTGEDIIERRHQVIFIFYINCNDYVQLITYIYISVWFYYYVIFSALRWMGKLWEWCGRWWKHLVKRTRFIRTTSFILR